MNPKIIYQDDALLVLNKPPGLVVDDSETYQGITLAQILKDDFQINIDRGGIVHRLDKDTSGLIIVSKTEEVLQALQSQFKNRTVKKEYTALVHGRLNAKEQVSGAIARNPLNRHKFSVLDDGKEASTEFIPEKHLEMSDEVLESIFSDFSKIQIRKLLKNSYQKYTLVKAFPKTGRTHQIRVHLKYIGFPILSDGTYGGRKIIRLDHRWCKRQFLHASSIEFDHPILGNRMKFDCPLSEDLEQALRLLNC